MKRWLKWTLLGLLAVLVIALLMALWITTTTSGLRFTLARAAGFVDNKLTIGHAEGSLLGGMQLRDVIYSDPEAGTYRIADIAIAPRSRALLSGELHLTGLTVRGVDATLPPPTETPPSDEPFALPELRAPLSMRIDELLVENVTVQQHDATPVIILDRITGTARWAGTELAIERFDVDAPDGELRLQADLDTGNDWSGTAGADFRWRLPDQPEALAGRIDLRGPQSTPSLRLDLREPSPALVDLDWQGQGDAATWTLRANSPGIALARLLEAPPLQTVAFDLSGTGGIDRADLSGQVTLDDYTVLVERLAGTWREQVLGIDALRLAEHGGPGRLNASGEVDLSGDTPTGQIEADWQAISPPLDAPFDQLASSGQINATGSPSQLVATVRAQAQVDGQPVDLSLNVDGDPQGELRIAPLTLVTGNGRLQAEGTVITQPHPSWQATLVASDFNPGLLVPDWPGRIQLDARTRGALVEDKLDLRVDIDRLGGTLRQRPLGGGGHIVVAGSDDINADLDLRLGDNRVQVDGKLGNDFDARVQLAVADPALLLDSASGRINGDLTVRGQWPSLAVAGTASASEFVFGEHRIGTLSADVDARTDFAGEGRVQVRAEDLALAGQVIRSLSLDGSGNEQANRLRLRVDAEQGELETALAGRFDRSSQTWSGELTELSLASPQLPTALALRAPAPLTLSAERVELGNACLSGDNSGLCLDGRWQPDAGGEFGYELTRLPLAWLTALSGDDTLLVDGELGGRGRIRIDADNRLSGQAQIEGTPGRIRLAHEADNDLVAWTTLATTVDLDGDRTQLGADIVLSPAGTIRADIQTEPTETGTALSGSIDLSLPELGFIALLTPEVINPRGEISGRMALSGTVTAPQANGEIALRGFSAELPAAGLRLRDTTLNLRAGSGNRIAVDGRVVTAEDSTLVIGGWFGLPSQGRMPMDISVTGERVLIADIPAARVFITPDLRVTADDRRLSVTGDVAIPQAMIQPEELEGGATRPSPDVHVTDEQVAAEEADGLPIFANIQINLGDRVRVDGYGLDGSLRGQLRIRERPGRATNARGEISVSGVYQAYGQDLDIERGRLIFSGPLSNPNLDIRATRKVETVTAGLQVTGNAQRPILEVYSVPSMDQAEALSYLVLGRPLRQATSSSDQDVLGTAAAAVTTAGGDLLAKSLGARLGLDEVGVGSSRELGAGALTIGKYLSPRLYLGYGRSLFDGGQLVTLRYRLTERFEAEVQSGTRDNKAGLNYRYER